MKYLVFSDIHGSQSACEKVIPFYEKFSCNKIIILGDILYHGPRNPLPQGHNPKGVIEILNQNASRILSCRGNCDAEVDQMVLKFQVLSDYVQLFDSGLEIFCTHGHIYAPVLHDGTKPAGCETASKNPLVNENSVILYGHTHVSVLEKNANGSIICNPGSISLPKGNTQAGFAVLQTKDEKNQYHKISLYNLDGEELSSLEF